MCSLPSYWLRMKFSKPCRGPATYLHSELSLECRHTDHLPLVCHGFLVTTAELNKCNTEHMDHMPNCHLSGSSRKLFAQPWVWIPSYSMTSLEGTWFPNQGVAQVNWFDQNLKNPLMAEMNIGIYLIEFLSYLPDHYHDQEILARQVIGSRRDPNNYYST